MADPADEALARLNDLSRQAEQTTEAMHSAQLDLNAKLAALQAAEKKHDEDQARAEAAKARLVTFQAAVNKAAVTAYMGGRTDAMNAILTADAPQMLIDRLSVQRVMAGQMTEQMAAYRAANEQATKAEQASAKSAADAKSAAEQAAAVRASLQHKQSQLQSQIAVVKSQYEALTPSQREALANPGAVPAGLTVPAPEALAPGAPGGPGAPPEALAPGQPPQPAGALPWLPGGGGGGGADRNVVVQAALTQVGTPYTWGGAAPGGFDCSGLVMWAYQQAGISLPHSSQAQAHGGTPVALSDLQPGDVLTFYSDASHAGIYIGDGLMVHASTYGVPVAVVPMESSGPIYDARRY